MHAPTIAKALLDIFTLIGPPAILQPDNGRAFSGIAKKELGEGEVSEVVVADVTASDVVALAYASTNVVDVLGGVVVARLLLLMVFPMLLPHSNATSFNPRTDSKANVA